jgi:hypothetical protein
VFILIIFSCTEQPIQKEKPKLEEPQEMPTQLIKSPDGNYYFPESIHRPKSDQDSLVTVYPSDLK